MSGKYLRSFHLKKIDIKVTFEKLNNREWYNFQKVAVPMIEDYEFLMMLDWQYYRKTDFDLAKMYMALYVCFGGHNNYDDYKCSFSYRFRLIIERNNKQYEYGLSMMDVKGNMPYFTYYRQPLAGEKPRYYQKPIDEQFSKDDMRLCTVHFIGFLEGFYEGYLPYFKSPFFRVNRAGFLIYGFEEGEFFCNSYDYETEEDQDNFQKAITAYKNKNHLKTDMSKDFGRMKKSKILKACKEIL